MWSWEETSGCTYLIGSFGGGYVSAQCAMCCLFCKPFRMFFEMVALGLRTKLLPVVAINGFGFGLGSEGLG